MKWFRWMCLCGLVGNLLLWIMPNSLRPYHVRRWIDDYKVALVEHTSEYGIAPNGIVRGRFSIEYSQGNPAAISKIRQDWYENISRSKSPCAWNSNWFQYDEWGPSHLIRSDGVDVQAVGLTYGVPFSLGALVCAIPLLWWGMCIGVKRLRRRACTSRA